MAFKKGHRTNIGRKASEKTKDKMRKSHRDYQTEDTKRKISKANKGNKRPDVSKRQKENNIAKRLDVRKKISENRKGKCLGKDSPNWKGGISHNPYSVDWTKTLRRAIRERDKHSCQICKEEGISVHHIDYNKENCNPNNLITLCGRCHSETNYNRKNWIKFFKERRFTI